VDLVTLAERAAPLEALGFTAREAAFLAIVVLHSGYCLPRQYGAFAGLKHGKTVVAFMDGLVERKLADRIVFRADRGGIYHVFGRRLYAALQQEDNRNRRHASPPVMARKLMALDFVLAHPDFDWYPEPERRDLFVTRLGIASPELPPRPLPLPIFLHGVSTCVNFVCLVTESRATAIESFVRIHTPLLRQLSGWTLNALIPQKAATDQACETAYNRAMVAASMVSVSKEDLDWFTTARVTVASGDLRSFSVEDLRRYRVLASTLGQHLHTHSVGPLTVHHLPHSYSQFGSFAGQG
jgi:hypothetical protein